jgi:hypothetical protein
MTITYTWTVYNLTVVPEMDIESKHFTNVVTQVWWILKAQDGSHVADTNGIANLPSPSMPFDDFEKLTQEQVIGWVQQILGEESITSMKASLAQRIENMIHPPVVHKLPQSWNPPAPEPQPEEEHHEEN